MKTYIFAGAQTISGDLVNVVQTTSKRRAAAMLKDDPRGFYKKIEEKNDCVTFVWQTYTYED